ncbi:MAG: histidine phosphatase family protein [Acidobacteriota bacterium]|nr:histidine phosphatase family protein [Acidobacteriota bacterium]
MPGRIILVRHGETEANRAGCFADSDEIPLTETGRRQAEEIARRLGAFNAHRIFSSPFARARETSEIIAEALRLEVEILEGIHERDFGCLKGHPYSRMGELMESDPAYDAARNWTWRPEGGESLEDVRTRAAAVLEEIRRRHADQVVLIVCHGAVIQCVSAHLTGDWSRAVVPGNCEILVIERDSGRAGERYSR